MQRELRTYMTAGTKQRDNGAEVSTVLLQVAEAVQSGLRIWPDREGLEGSSKASGLLSTETVGRNSRFYKNG